MLRQFEQQLTDQDWQPMQEGVEVKLVHGLDGSEVFVLARSKDRRQKEQAMHQRFLERMGEVLSNVVDEILGGRILCPRWVSRRTSSVDLRLRRARVGPILTRPPIRATQPCARPQSGDSTTGNSLAWQRQVVSLNDYPGFAG
jgi:hypothetical protein